jgi:hypothetical protein
MGTKAHCLNLSTDGLNFFRRCLRFHDHEHEDLLAFPCTLSVLATVSCGKHLVYLSR